LFSHCLEANDNLCKPVTSGTSNYTSFALAFKYLFNSMKETPFLFFGRLSTEFRARWGRQAANKGNKDRHPMCGIASSSLIGASASSINISQNAAAILKLWSDALGRTIEYVEVEIYGVERWIQVVSDKRNNSI
jgi:hypothetical protein